MYSYFYILQKNLILLILYFRKKFFVFRVISQLYKSKNLIDFNEIGK